MSLALVAAPTPEVAPPGPVARTEDERNTMAVFEAVAPAVVFVTQSRVVRDWSLRPTRLPSGTGAGFAWDAAGHVVTNYHVIEQERDISLMIYVKEKKGLRKEKVSDVRIVAFNPFFDLALLKIENPEKVPLRETYLGDYSRVKIGDPVFAIGNPLGLDRTVSDGIVSNRSRALGGKLSIQTTAAINPGNSGGPLFNNRGEVIGVTSSKIMGGESLGFAIPIQYVKDFLRNREAFAFDKDNPNTGFRYLKPPPKKQKAKKKK